MSNFTESKHAAEFIVWEADRLISREQGTLTSGQTVVDGQALIWSGGKLVVATGAHHTDGTTSEDVAGIAIGNWTVTADTQIPYLARLAVVKLSAVTLHTGGADSGKQAAVEAALANQFIIAR